MKLLVLDRDGVINEDSPHYIKSPDEWHAIPGSLDAIAELSRADWTIVVATNQSGLARGLFNAETFSQINAKMHRAVQETGGHIDAVFFCPHSPDAACRCRKPQPGLLLDIAQRYRVSTSQLLMVGDTKGDLQAVAAAGGRGILVRTGKGKQTEAAGNLPPGVMVFNDLAAVAADLLNKESNSNKEIPA